VSSTNLQRVIEEYIYNEHFSPVYFIEITSPKALATNRYWFI